MQDLLIKIEGSGNDFVMGVGDWARRLESDTDLVVRLCDRRKGIGADGILAIFPEGPARLRMVYRNSDGSRTRFCANGTRCSARVGVELLGLDRQLVVSTDWVEVPATVAGPEVSLELPAPEGPVEEICLHLDGRDWHGSALTVGVPHLVIPVAEDPEQLPFARIGPGLGRHPDIGPEGTNINLIEAAAMPEKRVLTWERGVEDETYSCGSGVVASALMELARLGQSSLRCRTHSNDLLVIEALAEPPLCPCRLTGPVRMVAIVDPHSELLAGV
jgi:diaminopimelate epimerase